MARERIYTRTGDDGTTGLFYGGPGPQGQRASGGLRHGRRGAGRPRAGPGRRPGGRRAGRACWSCCERDLWVLMAELATAAGEPPQAHAGHDRGDAGDGRAPGAHHRRPERAVRAADRVRGARRDRWWRPGWTSPAPWCAGPSGWRCRSPPPPSLGRPLPQPAVRPAVDDGPLAGGRVPLGPLRPRSCAATRPRNRQGAAMIADHRRGGNRATRPSTCVGVPVSASGPVPRQLGLPRARLVELGLRGQARPDLVGAGRRRAHSSWRSGSANRRRCDGAALRSAAAALARAAGTRTSRWPRPGRLDGAPGAGAAAQAVAEGFVLGRYRYSGFKTERGRSRSSSGWC